MTDRAQDLETPMLCGNCGADLMATATGAAVVDLRELYQKVKRELDEVYGTLQRRTDECDSLQLHLHSAKEQQRNLSDALNDVLVVKQAKEAALTSAEAKVMNLTRTVETSLTWRNERDVALTRARNAERLRGSEWRARERAEAELKQTSDALAVAENQVKMWQTLAGEAQRELRELRERVFTHVRQGDALIVHTKQRLSPSEQRHSQERWSEAVKGRNISVVVLEHPATTTVLPGTRDSTEPERWAAVKEWWKRQYERGGFTHQKPLTSTDVPLQPWQVRVQSWSDFYRDELHHEPITSERRSWSVELLRHQVAQLEQELASVKRQWSVVSLELAKLKRERDSAPRVLQHATVAWRLLGRFATVVRQLIKGPSVATYHEANQLLTEQEELTREVLKPW